MSLDHIALLFFSVVGPIALVIVFVNVADWFTERTIKRRKKKEDLEVELHNRGIREDYKEREKRYEERKKKIDRIKK